MKSIESEIISRLRWPLMVLVVLIHADIQNVVDYQASTGTRGGVICAPDIYTVYGFVRYFLCDVMARTAVPLFFLISGYLYFRWSDGLTWSIYREKSKRRIYTLVIPFFLWNAVYIIAFFALSRFSNDDAFNIYRDCNISAIFQSLWFDPPCFPFWFLRDLIVMCTITIVFYPLLKYGRYIVPFLLIIMWLGCLWPSVKGFSSQGCTFFLLGSYGGVHKLGLPQRILATSKSVVLISCIIYFILGLIETSLRETNMIGYIHNFNILVGIIVILLIMLLCINNDVPAISKTTVSSSFFLFGFHGLFIKMFRSSIIPIIKPASDIAFIVVLLADFVITIVVGAILYRLSIKVIPKTTALFCGGR